MTKKKEANVAGAQQTMERAQPGTSTTVAEGQCTADDGLRIISGRRALVPAPPAGVAAFVYATRQRAATRISVALGERRRRELVTTNTGADVAIVGGRRRVPNSATNVEHSATVARGKARSNAATADQRRHRASHDDLEERSSVPANSNGTSSISARGRRHRVSAAAIVASLPDARLPDARDDLCSATARRVVSSTASEQHCGRVHHVAPHVNRRSVASEPLVNYQFDELIDNLGTVR
ncbi:hypothetical protein QAD02_002399 [Eretmocerus hayati]|uniref:Uncharacterized protein n=1 Tax=Eretmocerus hayati TaxID=131215 RepID=A0ACC2NIT6_9HYME|nr:hypothetical protein QAD02_002399 [Eretmocerus hayati]